MGAAATAPRKKHEVPGDVRKRIAKDVKGGMGVSAVAAALNKEKVKSPSGGEWYAKQVYNIACDELNVDSIAKLRKSSPLKSRAVKDNPPRATTALPKKNGGAKKAGAAKPLSKKSQAAGTSRGGTGSKKKTGTARKTTAAARRRTTKRK